MRVPRVDLPQWVLEPRPERPVCGPVLMGVVGIVIPILLVVYGVTGLLRGEALAIGYGGVFSLYGLNAAVYAIAAIAMAVLLHRAALWDNLRGSTPAGARIKFLCLFTMGLSAYVLCIRMLPGLQL